MFQEQAMQKLSPELSAADTSERRRECLRPTVVDARLDGFSHSLIPFSGTASHGRSSFQRRLAAAMQALYFFFATVTGFVTASFYIAPGAAGNF
jgi:hypothetical protein